MSRIHMFLFVLEDIRVTSVVHGVNNNSNEVFFFYSRGFLLVHNCTCASRTSHMCIVLMYKNIKASKRSNGGVTLKRFTTLQDAVHANTSLHGTVLHVSLLLPDVSTPCASLLQWRVFNSVSKGFLSCQE